jgi:hypothetical protein
MSIENVVTEEEYDAFLNANPEAALVRVLAPPWLTTQLEASKHPLVEYLAFQLGDAFTHFLSLASDDITVPEGVNPCCAIVCIRAEDVPVLTA